jgi:hypothetical protein
MQRLFLRLLAANALRARGTSAIVARAIYLTHYLAAGIYDHSRQIKNGSSSPRTPVARDQEVLF